MDLHRTLLKDVILPKVKSVYVVDYYEGVRGLLESRDEFPYKSLFANPRLRSKTEILWSTDVFDSEPQTLDKLAGEEKDYYSYLLFKQLTSVRDLIEVLKTEDGGKPLSELLTRVISNIEDKSVYCGDDSVVIVNWGLIPRQPGYEGNCIFRSGKFIGNWEQAHMLNPREKVSEIDESKTKPNEEESFPQSVQDIKALEESDKFVADDTIEESDSIIPSISESVADETSSAAETDDDNSGQTDNTDKGEEDVTDGSIKDESVKNSSNPDSSDDSKINNNIVSNKESNEYNWKKFVRDTTRALIFLLRKVWWIILILILLILALFLFRDCQGPISKVNPFYNPLPEKPMVMPIEKDGVVMSEDGLYKVSNNRLNIILEDGDKDAMLEWAKAFKNHYRSADYEVVYYNEDLNSLQIKVPSDNRLKVLHELKSVLGDFSFDVFEESVYQGDFSSNDPALSDKRASWYLESIGAYSAWDMTLGSEDVIVAVVDNGFDLNHPEFSGKVVAPYNVLSQDANVKPITTNEGVNAHGTHVAATAIGKANNESGLLGIAPNCRFMPVQVGNDNADGSMSNTAIIEGVLYAINNGADVINVSLGKYAPEQVKGMSESEQLNYISNSFQEEEEMWNKVFAKAKERDCIIVFAAGNDNLISGIDPKKRNNNTIRVSAITPEQQKAGFSNYGRYPSLKRDYSTVSAPGVAIYSAAPGNQYQFMQGTSMAAPIVSGTLALMKSANKNLSAEESIRILQETGTDVGTSIGPKINLSKAVGVAMGKDVNEPAVDCDKIKEEVRRLQERIDSLSRLCPGATEPVDTLKYEDAVKDPRGLDGTWKTTTQLVNIGDNTPVELYMTFKNLVGTLTIVNNGIEYTAPLKATVSDKKISIKQNAEATSPKSETSFVPYKYNCSSDRKGNLFCKAKSSTNQVNFNLVRVK